MKSMIIPILVVAVFMTTLSCEQPKGSTELKGDYLGQTPPGDSPEVFAPGIICTDMYERDVAMTPDGKEMYFGLVLGNHSYSTIIMSQQRDGKWTQPVVAPFCKDPKIQNLEPHISPDGKKFFFVSNRPLTETDEKKENWDIWIMDRTDEGWGEPYNPGAPVNTEKGEFFPSVTRDGTLYFTREESGGLNGIYRSKWVNGAYAEPERLPEQINCGQTRYNAFVSPDESYIIVPAYIKESSYGGTDYYIVFQNEMHQWSQPINMGEKINSSSGFEWSSSVSPDSKYLFFMSVREENKDSFESSPLTIDRMQKRQQSPQNGNPNIYWISANIIESLRKRAVFK
ncbi:MAG: hypothetical protein GF421_04325 [Candidatus Aminicenantes bacterium]|nr:hypothetical protein [Candidatus Aminicenantes bacterium]